MNLYSKTNGYFDAESVIKSNHIFNFIVGGRGIGKTYSTLKYLIQNNITFIYLRRTQNESDLQASEMTSSLTKVLDACANEFSFSKLNQKVGMIEYDGGNRIYTCALSTFASIRGINFDDVKFILFDEFIKEPHVKAIKCEGLALLNIMESVGRNRETVGDEPLRLICLANSMDIANETFMQFDLVTVAENMMNKGVEIYSSGDILLVICQNSPISKKKAKTSLYINGGEEFSKMAISNEFILNDFSYVRKRNLREYKIILRVGDLYLYRHKNNMTYYVTFTRATTKREYGTNTNDLKKFRRAEWRYFTKYLDGLIYFENYKACALFEKYFD